MDVLNPGGGATPLRVLVSGNGQMGRQGQHAAIVGSKECDKLSAQIAMQVVSWIAYLFLHNEKAPA